MTVDFHDPPIAAGGYKCLGNGKPDIKVAVPPLLPDITAAAMSESE